MVHRTDHDFVKHTFYLFDLLAKVIRVFGFAKQTKKGEFSHREKYCYFADRSLSLSLFFNLFGVFARSVDKKAVIPKKYTVI